MVIYTTFVQNTDELALRFSWIFAKYFPCRFCNNCCGTNRVYIPTNVQATRTASTYFLSSRMRSRHTQFLGAKQYETFTRQLKKCIHIEESVRLMCIRHLMSKGAWPGVVCALGEISLILGGPGSVAVSTLARFCQSDWLISRTRREEIYCATNYYCGVDAFTLRLYKIALSNASE